MHDNTLARGLLELGIDVQLVPLYTPITTDEPNVTAGPVFFGGLNVYLQQHVPLFRRLPRVLDRWLDHPALLRWLGSRGVRTDATQLGELTLSMLKGSAGFQRKEVQRLCSWLQRPPRPDLLVLTNVLIAGCVPALKRALGSPVAVTLQGDDVFLDALPPAYRAEALDQIRRLADEVDALLVHSEYYAAHMASYLRIDRAKFRRVPLGIDTAEFGTTATDGSVADRARDRLSIGYLARIAPEKGLHVLVDAFLRLKQLPDMDRTHLLVAGWLGKSQAEYARSQFDRIRAAGYGHACTYLGTIDRQQKLEFLGQLHVLSVPTIYREPKGLYVLEALAAGVPVVQPDHGAFPELLAATGGGRLVPPEDPQALAQALRELLLDESARRTLATAGHAAVHARLTARAMAQETLEVLRQLIRPDAHTPSSC
ncbi:MAG: glycosyltransferase family 4 protein [Pirellulaceae bacterium]|jgi:glycosyltransferase involved in cell wall biosynthesis|nr:glycosyltransferase family 4 protein [Pirellulaceae bacterium]